MKKISWKMEQFDAGGQIAPKPRGSDMMIINCGTETAFIDNTPLKGATALDDGTGGAIAFPTFGEENNKSVFNLRFSTGAGSKKVIVWRKFYH